jgi:hypothetical protein
MASGRQLFSGISTVKTFGRIFFHLSFGLFLAVGFLLKGFPPMLDADFPNSIASQLPNVKPVNDTGSLQEATAYCPVHAFRQIRDNLLHCIPLFPGDLFQGFNHIFRLCPGYSGCLTPLSAMSFPAGQNRIKFTVG